MKQDHIPQTPPDHLNAKIGVLTRREVEARIATLGERIRCGAGIESELRTQRRALTDHGVLLLGRLQGQVDLRTALQVTGQQFLLVLIQPGQRLLPIEF